MRYAKQLLEDKAYRKEWTTQVGIGFTIPEHLYHSAASQNVTHDTLAVEIL